MDRGAHSVHRVVTSQIQLSSMQAVANLVRKGEKKKKAKPNFFKLLIPCPGELILQNPGGHGETPERWRTCFMAEMQPEVDLEHQHKVNGREAKKKKKRPRVQGREEAACRSSVCRGDRAVHPAASARGAGGWGQLSEDLENHLENLP